VPSRQAEQGLIVMFATAKRRRMLSVAAATAMSISLVVAPATADESTDAGDVFSTDFSEHPVGAGAPDGWTELFQPSDYSIADDPSRLVKTSTGTNRHVLGWEEPGVVDGDVEVATLMRVPDASRGTDAETRFQLHLLASGATGAIDTYHVDYTGTPGTVRIRRSVNNSQSTLASSSAQFDMEGWHNVVFQRQGDALRVKIWPYFAAEPEEWTVEAIDATHTSGHVGPGFFNAVGPTQEFAWFSVGTGDQRAERAPDGLAGIGEPQIPQVIVPEVQARYGGVVLNWDETAGADRYEVERDGQRLTRGWQIPSYADATIAPGATATYRVRGVSALAGAGPWSEPIEVQAAPLPDELALPFEGDPDGEWTSIAAEHAFLADLESTSPRVGVEEIGRSGQDRPLHLVRVGRDAPPTDQEIAGKPTILVACSQHGNEPAAREGCLWFLRELGTSEDAEVLDWLDAYAVLVIPTVNPDGRVANTRALGEPSIDGNRDHTALTSNEGRAVAEVLRDHQPDFVVDAHEMGTTDWRRGDLEVSAASTYFSHPEVRELAAEIVFDRIMSTANETEGWRSAPYGGGTAQGAPTLLFAGSTKHALTLLTESRMPADVRRTEELGLDRDDAVVRQRRVASQRFALAQTMREITTDVDRVTAATAASVAAARANDTPLFTRGSAAQPPGPGDTVDPPPCGWIVAADEHVGLFGLLESHGIEWETRRMPGGNQVTFVPAAQRARSFAFAILDGATIFHLDGIGSTRVDDTGWCRRGRG
jgi:hypothetical protein